jgi:hypothetical protein
LADAEAAFFIAYIIQKPNTFGTGTMVFSTSFAALFDAAGRCKAVYSEMVERVTQGGGKPCRQRLTYG